MSLISFSHLSFSYPKQKVLALDDVNLSFESGESFALLGPNGAGKTTLLRLLCGRLIVQKGKVDLAPELRLSNGLLDLSRCGVLLENPGVYPKLSIEEYLEFFAGFYRIRDPKSQIRKLSSALGFSDLAQKMGTLSQGMRQKVQIIRVMLPQPKLLLLDEPVANLDPESREAVWELLETWKKETDGMLVISSHILSEMDRVASSFAVLYRGKILVQKRMEELRTNEAVVRVKMNEGESVEELLQRLKNEGLSASTILGATPARVSLETIYSEMIRQCVCEAQDQEGKS